MRRKRRAVVRRHSGRDERERKRRAQTQVRPGPHNNPPVRAAERLCFCRGVISELPFPFRAQHRRCQFQLPSNNLQRAHPSPGIAVISRYDHLTSIISAAIIHCARRPSLRGISSHCSAPHSSIAFVLLHRCVALTRARRVPRVGRRQHARAQPPLLAQRPWFKQQDPVLAARLFTTKHKLPLHRRQRSASSLPACLV